MKVLLHGLLTGLFVFVMMDRLGSYEPPGSEEHAVPMPPGGPVAEQARVFVLLMDSLRHETAMDATIMPHLAEMRAEGASARVANIFNAVTEPSVRAIFTGREDASLLAFVGNFVAHGGSGGHSIFDQLTERGVRSIIVSQVKFDQFKQAISEIRTVAKPYSMAENEAQIFATADAMARGEAGLVVAHVLYTDHAAHRYGIGQFGYRRLFSRADALIPRLRARLPAGTTFVVLGDHGHNAEGQHYMGMDVPTYAAYVGDPFRAGADLGTIKLASNRYLLSAAFGLPLPTEGYTGALHPGALTTGGDEQPSATGATHAAASMRTSPPELRSWWSRSLLWLSFAVVITVWVNLAFPEWSPLRFDRRGVSALAWLPLAGCFLPLAWAAPVTAATGGAVLALASRGRKLSWRVAAWTAGAVAAAMLLHEWGRFLEQARYWMPLMTFSALAGLWAVVAGIGMMMATRATRTALTWVAVGAPALLLLPTNYRFGWTSVIVPGLFCWFLFYAVAIVREQRAAGKALDRGEWQRLLGSAVLIFLFAQAQGFGDARVFVFSGWSPIVSGWGTDNFVYLTLVGTAANFVILCDRPHERNARLVALLLAVLLFPLQGRWWAIPPTIWSAILAMSLSLWLLAKKNRSAHARALGLWFGLALWAYWMRPVQPNHQAVACLLAALAVAARFAARFRQPENERADHVLLLSLGAVVVGHALCRWSIEDLEWLAAYDWFEPDLVERFAALVLGWLIVKGLVPWLVMRRLVDERFPAGGGFRGAELRAVVGLKCVSVILIMTGLGAVASASGSYVEAAQQAAILGMLSLNVLLFRP